MITSELLTFHERCNRAGIWFKDWRRRKMLDTEMILAALEVGMTTSRTDSGMAAGEECYSFGADPGLETKQMDVHSQVVHLSAISDIVTTAIRKPSDLPWRVTDPIQLGNGPTWHSGAYLDPSGTHLRRVALASNWSDDRHYSECRSWASLGEVCAYGLPMQLVVVILGNSRNGKRHSFWTHGLRHPVNKKLRFRKRAAGSGFKETWLEVWREDYDEISTQEWLTAMLEDGVLPDVLFKVDIPVPEKRARHQIIDLAARKLEKIEKAKALPDQQLSTCDWPLPCIFRGPCHRGDEPSSKNGFVRIT